MAPEPLRKQMMQQAWGLHDDALKKGLQLKSLSFIKSLGLGFGFGSSP